MDAPPPPPPPSSPPPPAPPTRGATTIGKYIARFREEAPRPRDARATAQRADFWWLEGSASPRSALASRSGHRDDGCGGSFGASSPARSGMEWELELLSGASELSEETAAAPPSASRQSERDSVASSPSPAASPWQRDLLRASAPRADLRDRQRDDWRSEEDAVVVDDDFVVLQSVDAARPDEKEMLAASLEDPEMVIQRIRRRLGFQPPAGSTSPVAVTSETMYQSTNTPLSYSLSALRDDTDHDVYLQQSFESSEGISSDARSSLLLDLSMSLEEMSFQEDGGVTPTALSAVSPASPDFQAFQDSLAVTDEPTSPEPPVVDEPHEHVSQQDEEIAYTDAETKQDDTPSGFMAVDEEEEEAKHADSSADDEEADETTALQTGARGEHQQASAATEVSSSPARDDFALSKQEDAEPATRSVPQEGRTKQSPTAEEKRSPRLPPLSPARGPVFKPAPVTPRALDTLDPPEFTAETSKTLDSLLSFVVQSWGENSFFGSEDGGSEHASADGGDSVKKEAAATPATELAAVPPVPTPSLREEETQEEEPVAQGRVQEELGHETKEQERSEAEFTYHKDEVQEDKEEEEEDAAAFASDPVVAVLRARIDVLEAVLERLDSS